MGHHEKAEKSVESLLKWLLLQRETFVRPDSGEGRAAESEFKPSTVFKFFPPKKIYVMKHTSDSLFTPFYSQSRAGNKAVRLCVFDFSLHVTDIV